MARRKKPTIPEGCTPQALNADGLLVRGAGAPQGSAPITFYRVPPTVITWPKDPIHRPMPKCPYTGEV